MQGNFNVLTLNVRGLRNPVKRRSIFCFLKDQNCEAYLLQETYSELSDESIWRSEWGGVIFFSHGSTHSKGVCILMNPSLNCDFDNLQKDQNGRIVSVDLSLSGSKFSLCNIYVPNDQRKQQEFLHDFSAYLMSNTDTERLIVGGDWNITLQSIDKKGGTSWKSTTAREKLLTMMNEFALVDIFRERNQHKKSYTYESKALKLSSRIDFFLVARHLTKWVERVETKVSNAPDHRAVRLTLLIAQVSRGPGMWKFNNSLLEDEKYTDLIRENYIVISERYASLEDKRLKWELIKMELRGLTIPYAKRKARKGREKETKIQKRMEELDNLISNPANTNHITCQLKAEYITLKEDLCLIYENKAKGAIIRSKTKWIEQGEKPTKYFFNLEKRNYNRKVIRSLKKSDGESITDELEILKEIELYYRNLYSSTIDRRNDLFEEFVGDLAIPKLEDTVRDELEGEITLKECQDILCTFKPEKSPGDDGFTWEFCNCFFELLGRDLVDSFNSAYNASEMSISQRRGVITLVPKEDADLESLNNWRPITLLNLDYKIVSKIIARRIEKVLPLLVCSDQSGFVKGRYIGQNVRLINDILEQTKLQNIPGILLQLDFQKAFDTIEWKFI